MSDTTPAATVKNTTWAPVAATVISTLALLIFVGALVIAYLSKDGSSLLMLFGVAATNATTVINYWVGSSAGSARKDAQLQVAAGIKQG